MARRVRQSRIYDLASLMLIMWGALVFAGYLVTSFLLPRYAGYALDRASISAGVAGSVAISAFGYRQVRRSDLRCQDADRVPAVLRLRFPLHQRLGHFTPRQMGTFWPIYFMLLYIIAGLWVGHAFVVIGLGISALTLVGYFLIGDWFDLWMAFVNGGGLMLGGLWMRRS